MFARLIRTLRIAATVAVVFLALVAFTEVLRAYLALRELHPWAGWGFLILAGLVLIYLGYRWYRAFGRRPRVLRVPRIPDRSNATPRQLRRYGRYLHRYMRRLSGNEKLDEETRVMVASSAVALRADVADARDLETLLAAVRRAESETLEPAIRQLDKQAEQHVADCILDVMVAVAASPWNSIDMLVVLYRNAGMVGRITEIYNARPALREQVRIFLDTVRVVAAINFVSLTRKLLQNLGSNVPVFGRTVENLAQAVGAGVLTSVAGHAAILRCRAFRGWDQKEATRTLVGKLGRFLHDCWHIAYGSVMPILRTRSQALQEAGNDTWQRFSDGMTAAVEATGRASDDFLRKPVVTGTNQMVRYSHSATRRMGLFVRGIGRRATFWRRGGDQSPP